MQNKILENNRQADAIEITPAMVDAAVRYLHASGLVERPSPADALVVRGVLKRALMRRMPGPESCNASQAARGKERQNPCEKTQKDAAQKPLMI